MMENRNWLRIVAGAVLGALFGYGIISSVELLGIHGAENGAFWMAIIFALMGAIMGGFGWKYWVALGNDAADLFDNEDRTDNPAHDRKN